MYVFLEKITKQTSRQVKYLKDIFGTWLQIREGTKYIVMFFLFLCTSNEYILRVERKTMVTQTYF